MNPFIMSFWEEHFFFGYIFLLNFFTILTDLSPLNIQFLNPHGDDDGKISLLWHFPAGRSYFHLLLYISKIIYGKMDLSIENPWKIVLARYIKGNKFKFSKIYHNDYKIKILLILINLIEHPFMKITKEKEY
jgi:hypothetical protein